jgi:putative NADPH-quinone reductase
LSFTIGGPEDSYRPEGYNTYPIDDMLNPLKQTANLCGMEYLPPVFTHSMIYIPDVYNVKEEVEARAQDHAERLVNAIAAPSIA